MEELTAVQIITGLGSLGFIIVLLIEGYRKMSDQFGWFSEKKKKRQDKKTAELKKVVQAVIDDSFEKKIKPSLDEHTKVNKDQQQMLNNLKESSNDLMRHEMTKIYYKYLPYRRILYYDKESFTCLYKDYHTQDGNSFIDDIHEIISHWLVVTEEKDLCSNIEEKK